MALPAAFLQHLRSEGYDPRSNKHSNALAVAIADDLVRICALMRQRAATGDLVYDLNFDLHVGSSTWNVDLVLGRPSEAQAPMTGMIGRARPSSVEVAIEIKSIMTRHHNNAKNRKRDLEAHHDHVHRYDQQAIAGGVFVVNHALSFRPPRTAQATIHAKDRRGAAALVEHCLTEMRNIAERGGGQGNGMEAKCFIVLDMDNEHLADTNYVERLPAPQPGDPLNYDSFLIRICNAYEGRFRGQ